MIQAQMSIALRSIPGLSPLPDSFSHAFLGISRQNQKRAILNPEANLGSHLLRFLISIETPMADSCWFVAEANRIL